jgi:serine/threonine protein kinase/TolB-like protein/Flp pilus assembly protein TadD
MGAMSAEQWQRVRQLFHDALELRRSERADFLNRACGDDAELRREVESLLASHEEAGEFLSAPLAVDTQPAAPRQIGHYKIVGEIGRGGMGVVYRAVRDDDAFRKIVALKLLQRGGSEHWDRRFRQERQILAGLQHPNIAAIFDGGSTDDGGLYLVMEHVLGEPITRYCETHGLDTRRRLEIFRAVCDAVEHAHQNSVVHRDIKPGNIVVGADGTPKLLDFGIAKIVTGVDAQTPATATMQPVMTPEYASPEQVKGEPVTTASDVYSLGVVLYELLTGRRPYEVKSESLEAIVRVVCDTDPDAPSQMVASAAPPARGPSTTRPTASELRGDLDTIVLKALHKDPQQRYRSAARLSEDIRRHLEGLPITARRDGVVYRTSKFVQRNRAAVSAAAFSGVLLVALALVGTGLLSPRDAPVSAAVDSVAVLPLSSAGADPDAEYLSDGVTEGIIESLSRLPRLRVMAHSTTSRYKGKSVDARAVGRELGVRAVLAGRLQHQGGGFTMGVELVDARDGSRLWGAQYQRSRDQLLALQGDVAREIADRLGLALSPPEQQRLAKRNTESAKAYELYLRGRHFWNRRTPDDLRRGISYFEQAIVSDPSYALAYSGLADSYNLLAVLGALPEKEAYAKAKTAALQALELDDTLAEAHTSLASVRLRHEWDWSGAETEFRRAVALDPDYPPARYWYALYLAEVGRSDEAVSEARRAQEVDPLSLTTNYNVGVVLYYVRRYDDAVLQLQRTLELEPGFVQVHRYLALAYEQKGMHDAARASIEKAAQLSERSALLKALLAHVDAASGRKAQAERAARELAERPETPAYHLAALYVALKDDGQAFRWLEKAYAERSNWMILLKADPRLDGLRDDPRFDDLLGRVGLTP